MNNEPANGELLSHRHRSRTVTEFIQGLLNQNSDETHVVFCQLDTITQKDEEIVWRESARWVKYEEDVEENGKRWSKPHVASVTLHNVFELKSQMAMGAIMLECEGKSIPQLADMILNELAKTNNLTENARNVIRSAILMRHVHPHLKRRRSVGGEQGRRRSSVPRSASNGRDMNDDSQETSPLVKLNKPFMKKIPDGAEVSNVWVGELSELKEPITAFVRLSEARFLGDITEVPLPTRFIFLHLTPPGVEGHIFEIGRAMSTMMVDEIFSEVAYKAKSREDIMHAIDEFLDQVTILPPGQWDPKIRLEPPTKVPSQEERKSVPFLQRSLSQAKQDEAHGDPTLERTGRIFGGLVADVKRKLPFYLSDWTDGLHLQCLGSVLFMYLATLTPNITFGALLGQSTNQTIGTMECVVAVAFVNLMWALFSGQPLIIMGSTGPVLVLEIIIYNMCRDNDWEFFTFRSMIGLWCALFLMIMVAFDLSALVRYITRFTEESFACLISIIFIVESFSKIFAISGTHPFNTHPEVPLDYTCYCVAPNQTLALENMTNIDMTAGYIMNTSLGKTVNWTLVNKDVCTDIGGVLEGSGCSTKVYHDNVFFLSFILGIGTFFVAWTLVNMKQSTFFPTFVRQTLGDFAVFLSICCMVGLDAFLGVPTPKLDVPDKIRPTIERPWFVGVYSPKNPWWVYLAAALPALVAVILIFMDQQITAVIVNRKENKMKKGNGYHLDLLICTICIVVCSLFGLPWYVAATVRSMAHVNSLKMESECSAPGEKPAFLGIREQRLTPFVVAIMNGCSVFMTKFLKYVPMPVLYGVFLYMGISALRGMQFMDRILILFMPAKYQPDHMYLRHVRTKRVHLFTFFQVMCLAILWAIKAVKSISIVFPVMVLGTCFVRKGMERIFTKNELKWLDELMPEDKMMKQEDDGELIVDSDSDEDDLPTILDSFALKSSHNKPRCRCTHCREHGLSSHPRNRWNLQKGPIPRGMGQDKKKFYISDHDDSHV